MYLILGLSALVQLVTRMKENMQHIETTTAQDVMLLTSIVSPRGSETLWFG
jgi:hypothetical protein